MSRIGKAPIVLPAGVTVSVSEANLVTVTGPKGTLTEQVTGNVKVTLVENEGKKEVVLVNFTQFLKVITLEIGLNTEYWLFGVYSNKTL